MLTKSGLPCITTDLSDLLNKGSTDEFDDFLAAVSTSFMNHNPALFGRMAGYLSALTPEQYVGAVPPQLQKPVAMYGLLEIAGNEGTTTLYQLPAVDSNWLCSLDTIYKTNMAEFIVHCKQGFSNLVQENAAIIPVFERINHVLGFDAQRINQTNGMSGWLYHQLTIAYRTQALISPMPSMVS